MNSTIIGQRKPKENKRYKKKKRNQERRYSEGEASDYENHLQQSSSTPASDACNNNHCMKSTTAVAATDINKNQDAQHKNNLIFDIEI